MAKWIKNPTAEDKAKWAEEAKQRSDKAKELLASGVKAAYEDENYKKYLEYFARFHQYSFRNVLMIKMQMPEATCCASYKTWAKNGRQVRKGEKGLMVFVPTPKKIVEKNEDGNEEEHVRMFFKTGNVFDVSQTDGEPVPEICKTLKGSVENYENIIAGIKKVCPVPITFEDIPGNEYGYYSPKEQRVVIRNGIPEKHAVKTAIHETAHALLHGKKGKQKSVDGATAELQAESVAYIVCYAMGIETGEYSFQYVADWAKDKSGKALENNLTVIGKTASEIIDKLSSEM